MDSQALSERLRGCPFHRFLHMSLESVDQGAGVVSIAMELRKEFSRSDDSFQVHGGVIAALIDIAGDYAGGVMLGRGVPTVNLRIDYLRAARGNRLSANARVRKLGRTIGTADVDVLDGDGRLVAIGRGTYSAS